MRERNLLDDIAEIEQLRLLTPAQRVRQCLQLSAAARAFAGAYAGQGPLEELDTLEEKARLWAAPLRALPRK